MLPSSSNQVEYDEDPAVGRIGTSLTAFPSDNISMTPIYAYVRGILNVMRSMRFRSVRIVARRHGRVSQLATTLVLQFCTVRKTGCSEEQLRI
jgi:hypothetical protein